MSLRPRSLRPFRHVASRPVGDYRVFRTTEETIVDGDGAPRGTVFVLRCPDWCMVLPITADDALVCVWQHRFGTARMSLEVPAGMIDAGEAPEDAARRELAEEAGYAGGALSTLAVLEPNPALQDNRVHLFLAEGVTATGVTAFDAQEELETVLIPVADLPRLLDEGVFTHALCVVALERFLRRRAERLR